MSIKTLYEHIPHPHQPVDVNDVHSQERQGVNDKIAVVLTRYVGTMTTAYIFVFIALVGLLAILGVFYPLIALLVAWGSQTFIQLVLLPVIMVGQNVLNRHAELQSGEQYNFVVKLYHESEQMVSHLDAQDRKIVEIAESMKSQEKVLLTLITEVQDVKTRMSRMRGHL